MARKGKSYVHLDYGGSIRDLLMRWCPRAKNGDWVTDVVLEGKLFCTVLLRSGVLQYWEGGKPIDLMEDKKREEVEYEVFRYLDANKHSLVGRESIVELEDWEKMDWKVAPADVIATDGQRLGSIGVAYEEKKPDNSIMKVIFISADNTYATLTMYEEGNRGGETQAINDLGTVARCVEAVAEMLHTFKGKGATGS